MKGIIFTPIESKRLILRNFQDSDFITFLKYRNDPETSKFQDWNLMNEEDALNFIEGQKHKNIGIPGEWLQIAIEHKEHERHIGDCAVIFDSIDPRQAKIACTIDKNYQGTGYALEAAKILINFLFEELDLHRIIADTDPNNIPAYTLLEKLQFRREGHFLKNMWFKGQWTDTYLFALLKEEWENYSDLFADTENIK